MKYILGYFWDHGDDFKIISFDTPKEVRKYINKLKIGPDDYCLFKGKMLKSLDHRTFDLKNLK